jgi:hypothetical protein
MDGDAGEKNHRDVVGEIDRAQRLGVTVRKFENVKDAGGAAADVEFAAIFAEGEAVERLGESEKLRDLSCGGIDERDALLIKTAVDSEEA